MVDAMGNEEAEASTAGRGRGGLRRWLPWLLCLGWTAGIVGAIAASQWHVYTAGRAGDGYICVASIDNGTVRLGFSEPFLELVPNLFSKDAAFFSGRYESNAIAIGGWSRFTEWHWLGDWSDTMVAGTHSGFRTLSMPLLLLLVPPWLWLGWRGWRGRRGKVAGQGG